MADDPKSATHRAAAGIAEDSDEDYDPEGMPRGSSPGYRAFLRRQRREIDRHSLAWQQWQLLKEWMGAYDAMVDARRVLQRPREAGPPA